MAQANLSCSKENNYLRRSREEPLNSPEIFLFPVFLCRDVEGAVPYNSASWQLAQPGHLVSALIGLDPGLIDPVRGLVAVVVIVVAVDVRVHPL